MMWAANCGGRGVHVLVIPKLLSLVHNVEICLLCTYSLPHLHMHAPSVRGTVPCTNYILSRF
jgi:hypothetical protein